MRKISTLLLALSIASVSLSSCSRSSYSFNNTAPAYLGSEQVHVATAPIAEATPAAETVTATTAEATPVAPPTTAREAATALAHRVAAAPTAKTIGTAPATQGKLDHATRKALRQELKRQLVDAPEAVTAGGKSQLAALLLANLSCGVE